MTNLVRRIWVETHKINPKLKLSVCAIQWGSAPEKFEDSRAYNDVAQDWVGWAKEGIVDILLPMNYKKETDPRWKKAYRDWIILMEKNKGDAITVSGLGSYLNSIAHNLAQVKDTRELGADGTCIFRLAVNNNEDKPWKELLSALKTEEFFLPAPVPEATLFKNRETGVVSGKLTKDGKPLDSVVVKLEGETSKYETRTSGTGFYAFTNVMPGSYKIKIDKFPDTTQKVKAKKGTISDATIDIKT
jgi:hypothetical protein